MSSYNKSYGLILDELLNDIRRKGLPDFTTYNNNDPLVILLKLVAAMSVTSNAYSNKYLNSKFIQHPSTIDPKSMYLLLEEFNKVPSKVVPGTITIIFEYVETPNEEVYDEVEKSTIVGQSSNKVVVTNQLTIPEGTVFLINNIEFTILDDSYIKANNSYVQITIVEGKYNSQDFYKSNIKNLRLRLNTESLSMDYAKVSVDGVLYTKIDHAEYSEEVKVFSTEYDIDGYYNIVFSEKSVSEISDASIISVAYIESTGTSDYDPLADKVIIDSEVLYQGADVKDNIIENTVVGYTNSDITHDETYNYNSLPLLIHTYGKTITPDDYTNLTNYYPGVAISKAYDCNHIWSETPELSIFSDHLTKIVVAPTSGYYISSLLRDNLYKYYESIGLDESETAIGILDPEYVIINIELGVNTKITNQSELLDLYNSMIKTIEDYFKVGNIKFGSYISGEYIASLVSKLDIRINYVDVLSMSTKNNEYITGYQLNAVQLPLLGDLRIIFDYNKILVSEAMQLTDELPTFNAEFLVQLEQSGVSE